LRLAGGKRKREDDRSTLKKGIPVRTRGKKTPIRNTDAGREKSSTG